MFEYSKNLLDIFKMTQRLLGSVALWCCWLVVGLAWVAIPSRSAFAQATAVIRGAVADPQGAAIPGANVSVRQGASGLDRTTTTDQT
ncbi:MAG: carboxypeptidase-like regulatory domain-containing protein, partial [Luteitalea sp.]